MAPHGACTGRAQGLAIGKARVQLSRPAAISPGAHCRAGVWLARPPARRLPWLSAAEGGLWRASFCGVGCSGRGAPAAARRSGLASLSCAGPGEV